jgi:hypothetical protein
VLLGRDTELVVEGVVPNLLHVVPVADDAVLDRVLEGEDTPLGLGLIPNIGVLLPHPHHHTSVAWAPNDTWEDGPGRIIPGETSLQRSEPSNQYIKCQTANLCGSIRRSCTNLDHAGAIVTDKGLDVLAVSHLVCFSVASHRFENKKVTELTQSINQLTFFPSLLQTFSVLLRSRWVIPQANPTGTPSP